MDRESKVHSGKDNNYVLVSRQKLPKFSFPVDGSDGSSSNESSSSVDSSSSVNSYKRKQPRGRYGQHEEDLQRRRKCDTLKAAEKDPTGLKMVHASVCTIHANMVSIEAKYEAYIKKFRLSLSSQLVQLHEEVAKMLNLKAGTFCVVYDNEEDENILIACDEDLQLFMRTSRSLGST